MLARTWPIVKPDAAFADRALLYPGGGGWERFMGLQAIPVPPAYLTNNSSHLRAPRLPREVLP
jgi:hypothetical protein